MARNLDGQGRRPHEWRGRWRAYLTVGYKRAGKPDRRFVYADTAAECQVKLDELRGRHKQGAFDAKEARLGDWLEAWLRDKAQHVSPRTVTIYRAELKHLPRRLTDTKLENLTARMIQDARALIAEDVSARAARYSRSVLSSALKDAMRMGLIVRNPDQVVRGASYEPPPITVWSAGEVAGFIDETHAGQGWYHALFYTALTTGARSSQLYALRWSDLEDGRLSIERTSSGQGKRRRVGKPKTRASRRVLKLSRDTVAAIEAWRARLTMHGLESELMFPSEQGGPLQASNVRRGLHYWADKAGVPRLRPHDLRHTFASMAIAQGMTPAELARQLGHTNPGFTLQRYVHFFERYQPREALGLDELTGRAKRREEPEETERQAVGGT